MENAEVLLLILAATAAFGLLARRLRVPDAIVLVLAGLGVAFIPGLPHPQLDPQLVFLLFLPPLLFSQAWFTSWREFWRWKRPIFMLAVGLVLFTTFVVALVLHWLEPQIPFAVCCAFGAIVSPPDAVAAAAIGQAYKLPRRLLTILEGESLVNDATGLVALQFALAAVKSGQFSIGNAAGRFALVVLGGIGLGLAVGVFFAFLLRRVRDDSIAIALSLVAPYGAYLAAEHLGVSGVLAVVTAGIWLGSRGSELLSPNARLKGFGFWNTFVFLLNGAVFLLIGLQLPVVTRGILEPGSSVESIGRLLTIAVVMFVTTVVVRLAWVFPGAYVPRLLFRSIKASEPNPNWRNVSILGWAGMRGVVSLAAALALPPDLPYRHLLIFLTFAVILGTLVVQGLTLPLLIRWLRVGGGRGGAGASDSDETDEEEEEHAIRIAAASSALHVLRTRPPPSDPESLLLVTLEYEDRLRRLHAGRASLIGEPASRERVLGSVDVRRAGLEAERRTLLDQHRRRTLSRELLIRLERELDLEESRLAASAGAARAAALPSGPVPHETQFAPPS